MLLIKWLNETFPACLVGVSVHQPEVREEYGAELVLLEPYYLFVGIRARRIQDIFKS